MTNSVVPIRNVPAASTHTTAGSRPGVVPVCMEISLSQGKPGRAAPPSLRARDRACSLFGQGVSRALMARRSSMAR